MSQKYIVTGGAGFIGSHLANCIRDLGEDILVLDSMSYASQPENLKSSINVEEVDISDPTVSRIISSYKPDIIMNLAAHSHVDRSISSPKEFISSNISGVLNLLELVRGTSTRFHQISTDEVFGDLDINGEPFTENSPYKPSSVYSASKASADHLVNAYIRTHNVNAIISGCSNNYGPGQHPEKFIPSVIGSLCQNEPIKVYGNGLNIRDWIYVEDHIEALVLLANSAQQGEHYLIGGKNEKTNLEVVDNIISAYKPKEKPVINHIEDRKGHDYRYAVNTDKIKNHFGWFPETDWYEGIAKTIEWYKEKYNARHASTRA